MARALVLAPATHAAAGRAAAGSGGRGGRRGPVSTEQGQTPLDESFELEPTALAHARSGGMRSRTPSSVQLRTMYLDRDKFDGSESDAGHRRLGRSQDGVFPRPLLLRRDRLHLAAPPRRRDDKDGALLLAPGQEGYSVLGELYADIRIVDDLNLYVGRKEFDTPFINRNDVRMTPNTFEAITLQGAEGRARKAANGAAGLGYFDKSRSGIPMSLSRWPRMPARRGPRRLHRRRHLQEGRFLHRCDRLLQRRHHQHRLCRGEDSKFALAESPSCGWPRSSSTSGAWATTCCRTRTSRPTSSASRRSCHWARRSSRRRTHTTDGANMQNPWSGYPGYTSVQVEDFNRAGEDAFLLRAGYKLPWTGPERLRALGPWHRSGRADQFREGRIRPEPGMGADQGALKGLVIRLRYALVEQDGHGSRRFPGDGLLRPPEAVDLVSLGRRGR